MKQITMKIDSAVFEKIKARMEKNGCKTLAQCARELLELGLRIEEAAANQEAGNEEDDVLAVLLNLTKKNTQWALETRFFVKFLMENCGHLGAPQLSLFMEKAKERAAIAVDELVAYQANIALQKTEGG